MVDGAFGTPPQTHRTIQLMTQEILSQIAIDRQAFLQSTCMDSSRTMLQTLTWKSVRLRPEMKMTAYNKIIVNMEKYTRNSWSEKNENGGRLRD